MDRVSRCNFYSIGEIYGECSELEDEWLRLAVSIDLLEKVDWRCRLKWQGRQMGRKTTSRKTAWSFEDLEGILVAGLLNLCSVVFRCRELVKSKTF
jgi:hypothetical protein